MWIATGFLSVLCCIAALAFAVRRHKHTVAMVWGSCVFALCTFLLQFKLVAQWVNHGDLAALWDVVPTQFRMLCVYTAALILTNGVALLLHRKKQK